MCVKRLFETLLKTKNSEALKKPELSRESIALHEAAHGIVWYLFKDNWIVNSLSIEQNGLPDENMKGALHITANFDIEIDFDISKANEIFAISFAGMIGQNIIKIRENDYINFSISQAGHFNEILDTTGCGGDFEIINTYLPFLSQNFGVSQYSFVKIKIMDLVILFQDIRVQQVHHRLSQNLLAQGTISKIELEAFFESLNFQEYIEDENLDINFYHQ